MKAQELRKLSANDLNAELTKLLEEKFKLMMQKGTGRMAKNHLLSQVKRNIARVKTIMNESR